MSAREKKLAALIGSIVVLLLGVAGFRMLFLNPLREIDKKTAALKERLEKVNGERRAFFTAEEQVKQFAQRSFSEQVDQASAKSGEMLTQQILASGLREADFSRLPTGPRKLPGASELGWSVQGDGALTNVLNLLFLLRESPWTHRIENLVINAGDPPGQVRVRFRYLTLVVDPAPLVEPLDPKPPPALDSPERKRLAIITTRDILRPYIRRSPAETPAPAAPQTPAAPPGPEAFRVVSLTEWQGEPEVHVRDLVQQKTIRYKLGDPLAGGLIEMVDYRPLPIPGNETLQSSSRVILRIGPEFWAIERGRTLAEKYLLTLDKLPDSLARAATISSRH